VKLFNIENATELRLLRVSRAVKRKRIKIARDANLLRVINLETHYKVTILQHKIRKTSEEVKHRLRVQLENKATSITKHRLILHSEVQDQTLL
jgi:hypothetical protein